MSESVVVKVSHDLEDIMPCFLQSKRQDVVDLEKALRDADCQRVAFIGHRIAGSAGGYGMDELGRIAAQMEMATKEKNWELIKEHIAQIKNYLTNVKIIFVDEDL